MLRFLPCLFMLFLALANPPAPNTPKPILPDLSLPSLVTGVEVKSLRGFNSIQELRFRHISANVQLVINHKLFREKILTHTYNKKLDFVDTTDTPAQVYAKIMSKPWVLEYRLEKIKNTSVIGYTYPSVSWIALSSGKWLNLKDWEIARNICHEYGGHKFGRYSHAMKWSRSRDFSAPYGIGKACSDVYKVLFP